jgi:hypothetical protein
MVLLWRTWDSGSVPGADNGQVPLPLTAAVASLILVSRGDTREKALPCLSLQHWRGDAEVLRGDRGGWEGGGL